MIPEWAQRVVDVHNKVSETRGEDPIPHRYNRVKERVEFTGRGSSWYVTKEVSQFPNFEELVEVRVKHQDWMDVY